MGLSGLVGAGASDALDEVILQALAKQKFEEQVRAQQAQEALQTRRINVDESQHQDAMGMRGREFDQRETARRDQSNRAGVADMERQAASMAAGESRKRVEGLIPRIQNPSGQIAAQLDLEGVNIPGNLLEPPVDPEAVRKTGLEDYEKRKQIDLKYRPAESSTKQRHPHVVNGKLVYLTEDEVNGMGGVSPAQRQRPVTGQERNNLGFYQRAQQAEEIVTPLEKNIATMGLGGQMRLEHAPNFLQSGEGQQYRQAQRAFTEARLRKESGAAIPEGEYANDAKTYFAQPGDTPETITQKQQARKVVLESLATSTGSAWEEHFGEPRGSEAGPSATQAMRKPIPGIPGAEAESTDGGKTWKRVK